MAIYSIVGSGGGYADAVHEAKRPVASQAARAPQQEELRVRADSVVISPQGEALTKLSQLHQSDGVRFKEVASELSERLRQRAEAGDEGAWIQRLADRFARAADTGDFSAVTLDRAVPANSEPHVVWQGGRGDGAELAWAGLLVQIGEAMASAQHAASSQAAHRAKVVVDVASVQRVAGIEPSLA